MAEQRKRGFRPKRGAIPSPRHMLAAAMPFQVKAAAPAPAQYLKQPAQLSFWGNDKYSDCATVEEAFAKACHDPEIFITDQQVIAWATAHNALNGAVISTVLQQMHNDGFLQEGHLYSDGPHFSVNWTNRALLVSAISTGPVKIGVGANQLEATFLAHGCVSGWVATGYQAESVEDHCVSLCGYGPLSWLAQQLKAQLPAGADGAAFGYGLFTWSSIGVIDEPSMLAITHEAWVRHPTTIIG